MEELKRSMKKHKVKGSSGDKKTKPSQEPLVIVDLEKEGLEKAQEEGVEHRQE